MPRENYQTSLGELRSEVTAMGDLTLDRYDEAVAVLDTGDPSAAADVIQGDAELNEWYLDIESDCVELLALQQPVAGDLRFIASSFKIVTDLERVGDLATNLARYGREAEGDLVDAVDVDPIATQAGEMVSAAIDAYATEDVAAAKAVAARDDDLDELCKDASEAVVRQLLTIETESGDIESTLEDVSRALLTIRDLERVGDHAVNICARTVYMVENDDSLIY